MLVEREVKKGCDISPSVQINLQKEENCKMFSLMMPCIIIFTIKCERNK